MDWREHLYSWREEAADAGRSGRVSVHHVRTWVGPDAIPGITEEGLKAETERSPKQAGIALDPRGSAELFLYTRAMLHEGNCFVTIEGRLVEPARLDRNRFMVEANSGTRAARSSS